MVAPERRIAMRLPDAPLMDMNDGGDLAMRIGRVGPRSLQLVSPGKRARPHHHPRCADEMMLEGQGEYRWGEARWPVGRMTATHDWEWTTYDQGGAAYKVTAMKPRKANN